MYNDFVYPYIIILGSKNQILIKLEYMIFCIL